MLYKIKITLLEYILCTPWLANMVSPIGSSYLFIFSFFNVFLLIANHKRTRARACMCEVRVGGRGRGGGGTGRPE